ncbi:uncharacterized protein COX8 [Euwallacea similis]|uniref:uncharacterized protein COX8 n=1 Tax=Euwallacea similis TaxID=1736056 RepID=UPI0034501A12
MFAATSSKLVQRVAQQSRNMSVISGPPTVRVSFAEKVAHGMFITIGLLAVPTYVLVNIKNYRKSG